MRNGPVEVAVPFLSERSRAKFEELARLAEWDGAEWEVQKISGSNGLRGGWVGRSGSASMVSGAGSGVRDGCRSAKSEVNPGQPVTPWRAVLVPKGGWL